MTLSFLYLLAMIIWFNKDALAYKITGAIPGLVEKRSLTQAEYQAWLRVPKAAHTITIVFALVSALFGLTSLLFLKKRWFHPPIVPKIAAIIALLFFLLILLANSISWTI